MDSMNNTIINIAYCEGRSRALPRYSSFARKISSKSLMWM
ncbi:conserved hypothetical protein [delta proteobacterium NaphS2]|nr:conserved hypothetical protein [delta proteobacterium NaphS2]